MRIRANDPTFSREAIDAIERQVVADNKNIESFDEILSSASNSRKRIGGAILKLSAFAGGLQASSVLIEDIKEELEDEIESVQTILNEIETDYPDIVGFADIMLSDRILKRYHIKSALSQMKESRKEVEKQIFRAHAGDYTTVLKDLNKTAGNYLKGILTQVQQDLSEQKKQVDQSIDGLATTNEDMRTKMEDLQKMIKGGINPKEAGEIKKLIAGIKSDNGRQIGFVRMIKRHLDMGRIL